MPTICPNCLRPVRMGAKYCGFCGTSLAPSPIDESVAALSAPQEKESPNFENNTKEQPKRKRSKARRTVLVILIIILCLAIILALFLRYWEFISPLLIQILALFRIR